MLARRVKIRLQKHRTALYIHRIRDGSILVAPSGSSREFSLSTITEPITRAAETLPLPLQYNIPESILNLSEAWVPAGLPTYTTGIVVFAILTRLCLFTPWSYWARKRKWRVQEQVRPQIIAEMVFGWGPHLQKKLDKVGVTPEKRREIVARNLALREEELEKIYKCTKWPTFFFPIAFTLPAFVFASSVAYSAAVLPAIAANPGITELFLMPDVPPYLPIGIAVLSLLSVEIGTLSPRTLKAMRKMNEKDALIAAKKLEEGNTTPTDKVLQFKPNLVAQSAFRLLGIGRGLICIGLPGTVNVLWFTSTLFGAIEALIFTAIERSRAPKHWGRNSRLLLEPRAKLQERGFDLSPLSPLERAGIENYSKNAPKPQKNSKLERTATNVLLAGINGATAASEGAAKLVKNAKVRTVTSFARAQETVHDVVLSTRTKTIESVVPKVNKIRNLGRKDLVEWKDEAVSHFWEWKDIRIEKMEKWLEESKKEKKAAKRARKTKVLSAQDLQRREQKRRQWLYVLSQMNKAKAQEARRQAQILAAREEAARNIPGLVPMRPKRIMERSSSQKPLIN